MRKNARGIVLAIAGVAILIAMSIAMAGCGDEQKPTTVTPENRGIGGPVPSQVDDGTTESTGSAGKTAATGKSNSGASGGSEPAQGAAGAPPKQVTVDPGGTANASKGKTSKLTARTFTIIKLLKGDRARLRIKSDVKDVLHIYGYEKMVPLPAGKVVSYSFKANRDGLFVMQFKQQGINVGELRVSP